MASAPAPRPEKPSGAVPTTRAAAAAVPEAPPVPLPGPAPEVATPPAGGERGASGVPSRRAIPRPAPVPAPAELRLIVTTRGGLSWAFVDLDGLRQGSTPMTVRVEPGTHRLVFMREGFERVSREVTVGSGEKRKLSVELTATGK